MLLGEDDGCEAGTSLAAAGDTNADGLDELLIGQPGCHAGAPGFGSAAVVRGTGNWLDAEEKLAQTVATETAKCDGDIMMVIS